jgi:hypothetical protein
MPEHESTFPPSPPPPPAGGQPPPPARREPHPPVEWLHFDIRNHSAVVCLKDGVKPQVHAIITVARSFDPELFSIVVMSGPWLVGAYYLGPKGWTLLELPDYDLGH